MTRERTAATCSVNGKDGKAPQLPSSYTCIPHKLVSNSFSVPFQATSSFVSLFGLLVAGLVGWLVAQSVGWLVGWLVGRSVGWLVSWLVH